MTSFCKRPLSVWFGKESSSPGCLCGNLSVTLKYNETGEDVSEENIPLVRLAMTKLPAKSKRKGSVIIISGGPGLPGINPYINFDWPVTNLRESWDIIGFDPRGVGQSFPAINCQQSNQERLVNVSEKQLILQKINACIHNTGAE
ncbi:alpha/beta fold hydrolase, partial [Escherichia coli]|uniref:alpha/beta fold hydrolase n=1 Tax=Escherichia coli TaxID=562 RepID=UPI00384C47CD